VACGGFAPYMLRLDVSAPQNRRAKIGRRYR
jgi:hypothetical protein